MDPPRVEGALGYCYSKFIYGWDGNIKIKQFSYEFDIVLQGNTSVIAGFNYLHVQGIAMETMCASLYTTLYL